MNYFQKKKLAFMSIVNRVKGFVRTVTGALPLTLEGCVDEESIIDYTIYGNSVQDGTPTPATPIEVESVGEFDESTGKYKIPIKISSNDKSMTTNIYLDEPLRKVGDYADYIKSVDLVNGTGTVASVVKEMVVDSSTRFHYSALSTDSESAVFFNPKDVGSAKSACDVLSNYFPTVETDGCQVWRNTSASNSSHFIKATNEIFEIDETDTTNDLKLKKIKAWLDAQKAINPVLCYYILKTPTETPITLPKIPTFKGTSILTVGTTIQPSNVEITYYSNVKE